MILVGAGFGITICTALISLTDCWSRRDRGCKLQLGVIRLVNDNIVLVDCTGVNTTHAASLQVMINCGAQLVRIDK